ncbi:MULTISPECIES: type I-E CRISPR-associated protein Cas7/Cse4/CasC [Tenebrionibacter/Tenebrionicola group]|uniref:Type I-E CRISPR-associated protein Cas7/Cse4/CasC n=2 Tax=Tenebrionibacter/Tenebrionicola group TaxID=2969848 RepID=A0A8K0XX39_9ENTR|nr:MULTISPECIES: type I-E CRISPR-associated protein Cas7/Cse4/CasC [Tenebrionibacter/Tenebrionicola group]MBK4715936.1 type I-E CRISPR-associated protein Cas7/Cse4/CasC [Tenebrionibacter intestinalis]MBV4411657.1 type I-E CRISPR-associated protein Cas7/Cse4/CasC [Tenebrionicola larvae]MBV5096852.1 type I-E CRISPR-associated protein Cas7/Cse4/CasC [Tenebrionicola larvae]
MTTFIQLHLLTSYAPSNLNRDDTGQPKTAFMGGVKRLRVSSQSLKRAWRVSPTFSCALDGDYVGIRTRCIGSKYVYEPMKKAGVPEKLALSAAEKIAERFGKRKNDKNPKDVRDNLNIEQVVNISVHEKALIEKLVATLIEEKREPQESELDLLRKEARSVDMALFGRMLASEPDYNVEAACQVAHALGVSAVLVEDDFFTAVDDLNLAENDTGSGHMGEQGFASALFYTYICISRDLLLENLDGNEELTARTIAALTQTAMTVSPGGKQNSFASRAYASYALVEKGEQQPRSLSVAFLKPVAGDNQLMQAIASLEQQCCKFDNAYGACADKRFVLNVEGGASAIESAATGPLPALLDFVRQ